jgi:ureidoglycolate lyase
MSGLLQTRVLRLEPLTQEAFAAFGAVIEAPPQPGQRNPYTQWMGSERAGMTARLHVNHIAASVLPLHIDTLERHPHSAQIFVPLQISHFVVAVAPTLSDGTPDTASAKAFLAPGTLGILYAKGVWHMGATVLDRPGSFSVLMWRNDSSDDEEFYKLSEPLIAS